MSESRGRGQSRGNRPTRGTGSRGRPTSSQHLHSIPSSGIPSGSVSKIKAQLRQTKRLLAKEDLNPDVKTTTERRLVALEDELVKAEKGLLEKKMVTKYRGVKFFERQKVLRRIKQAKKSVEMDSSSSDEAKLQESKKQLFDARMDLYYILRYPKTEKYLALYPENTYIPFLLTLAPSTSSSFTPSDPSTSTSTSSASSSTPSESDRKRWELRNEIRKKVSEGTWSEESEGGDLGIEGEEDEKDDLLPVIVGEKRGREVAREEVEGEEKSVGMAKKRKVVDEEKQMEDVDMREEKENEGEKEVATGVEEEGGEPKPLNRKQKKALKKALEAQGEGVTPQVSTTMTTTTTTAEGDQPGEEEGAEEEAEGEGEGKKLNRKQKKALKRAQEAGQNEATTPLAVEKKKKEPLVKSKVADKGGKKVEESKKKPETKAEKLAMEDDFFA
ncbi:hypothetical protein JCM5353_000808 [Sporobolomyces roseus]